MTDFSRRQEVIGKIKAQMRGVCVLQADGIAEIRSRNLGPHVVHTAEPNRVWAEAPDDLSWPNVLRSDPKELLRR